MLPPTAEDLAAFVTELRQESDRGLALVGCALIDDGSARRCEHSFGETPSSGRLLDEGNAPLGTLSARADACFALGLIDEQEHAEIALLRKVRNEFAHAKHGVSFAFARVSGLCSSLTSDLPEGADYPLQDPRFRFTNATVSIVLRLYHRPDWVVLERRPAKAWVDADATRWRSMESEPPPSDAPTVAMAKSRPREG